MNGLALLLLVPGLLAGTGIVSSFAPEPYAEARVFRFANGTNIDTRMAPLPGPAARMESGTVWLIHLTGPVQSEWLAELRNTGAEPVCYLAYQTVVCRLWRDAPASDFRALPFVDWLGPHPAAAKLAPELLSPSPHSSFLSPLSSLFVLSVWPGEDPNSVAAAITGIGADVADVTGRSLRFRLDASRLPEIAALAPVAWIQEYSPAQSYNSDVQWVMQVGWRPERPDEVSGRRIWAHGIRGQNMVVGLFDSLLDVPRVAFLFFLVLLIGIQGRRRIG